MSFSINKEDIASFHKNYRHHPNSSVLENTVTKNGVRNASFNWHSIADNTPHFSIDLKTGMLLIKTIRSLLDVCGTEHNAS